MEKVQICTPSLGLQDIFQQIIDKILECCEGAIQIADGIVIHRKDDEEHNWLMHVACEHRFVFNGVKKDTVTFFGIVYDTDGAHPDPKKVDTVHQMPSPDTPSQLQPFLGMVTYLSPNIPLLSTHIAPLWELLKRKPSTASRNWSARIRLFPTFTFGNQSPSKSIH